MLESSLAAQPTDQEAQALSRPMRILVIDDNQKLLEMLRRTLSYEGFRVRTAASGREALEAIDANRPDLLGGEISHGFPAKDDGDE